MINLSTTFNYKDSSPFTKALTKARPDNSWALWFRLPGSLKWSLEARKEQLILDIKEALNSDNKKEKIKEVFVELLISLETWFTNEQIKKIINNYDKFNSELIVPIEELHWIENTYLLNESYWPTDAFKDIALQMVTSMVSIIVEEENKEAIKKALTWEKWQTLKFVITQTSTSWDTGPAWWSWIEWKAFVMNVIGFPENEATFAQKWQMMNLKWNVMSISMNTSFSKIQESMLKWNTQDFQNKLKEIIEKELKDLISKYDFKIKIDSWSFNSINPWRVDWQTIYHSFGLLQAKAQEIIKENEWIIEVIPSWNWWHMYSVLMARLMTWEKWKTIVTCNRNNMFYKIIEEWRFKKPLENTAIDEPSVSMIIEYPNNMIRLFSYAFWEKRAKDITDTFFSWKEVVFTEDEKTILKDKLSLIWVEVSWSEELITIWKIFKETKTLICPHTANAIAWLKKYRNNSWDIDSKALVSATASPWKFLAATAAGLSFNETDDIELLYKEYKRLENTMEWAKRLLDIIKDKYNKYWVKFDINIIPDNLREIYTNGYIKWETYSPDDFWLKTIEFLEKQVAPMFKKQIIKLID